MVRKKYKKMKHTLGKGNPKNLNMDDSVYKLRRKVMEFIYEARKLVRGLPRVNIRITEKSPNALGYARLGRQNNIWIPLNSFKKSKADLRHTVYHELVHTLANVKHDENSPLMKSIHPRKVPSKAVIQKEFKRYMKEAGY